MENWRVLNGFDHSYQVSDQGNIKGQRGMNIGFLGKDGYKHAWLRKNGKYKNVRIHLLVWEAFGNRKMEDGFVIDHLNENKADNRIKNLQLISFRKNVHKSIGKTKSGIIGVFWAKDKQRWSAMISINNKRKRLGYRKTVDEAKELYEQALNPTL